MHAFLRPLVFGILWLTVASLAADEPKLLVGFAESEITPDVNGPRPVWIAGYGHGRRATGVHDPITVRAAVLLHGPDRMAFVAVDLVGLQYPEVKRIRNLLNDYRYVMVGSTHNHEGPDVIGIWGATPVQRGVDGDYLQLVVDRVAQTVRAAEQKRVAVTAAYGTAKNESLVQDSRQPEVKDGVLRVVRFNRESDGQIAGIWTQFSCHPESLGSRNTLLTADFPHFTVAKLKEKYHCPIVYFSGAVGGLMSNPSEPIRDQDGREHREGTFEYAKLYGEAVADGMITAVDHAQPVRLWPFAVSAKPLAIPIENPIYRAAREIGVLQRDGLQWTGDPSQISPLPATPAPGTALAMETEVSYLRLGELHVAGIPGELYPELVYARVQDPVDPGADFPEATAEPAVSEIMPGDKWLILGLANDEIGYIIPKRQWDEKPPFCYGRTRSQYGEINSCGPSIAPLIMHALRSRVREVAPP